LEQAISSTTPTAATKLKEEWLADAASLCLLHFREVLAMLARSHAFDY